MNFFLIINPWDICSKEQHWRRYCTLGPSYSCKGHLLFSVLCFALWGYDCNWNASPPFKYLGIICVYLLSRFISWIARYGMLYSLHFSEVYMGHSVALERLEDIHLLMFNYLNYDKPQPRAVSDLCMKCLVSVSNPQHGQFTFAVSVEYEK